MSLGSITLVGAGPGDPELITVAGARALAAADVVVYDRLVAGGLLDLAPRRAELIPVGKAKGCGVAQADIEAILLARAAAGRKVVRLKGGDPFVFGRGAEEVAAAHAAGIAVRVVPGVSSALAAPAAAGIPVTHRELAGAVTILSGHRVDGAGYDWDALARSASTLVVLMGASTAVEVARRLVAAGRPCDDPVAIIHAATTAHQRVERLELADLAAGQAAVVSPSVIVIGPVARLTSEPGVDRAADIARSG